MFSYPLKALDANGNPHEFTIRDGVLPVSEDEFILDRLTQSPVLKYSTVQRGCDIPHLFSGDYVLYKGVRYLVSYNKGIVGRSIDGSTTTFDEPKLIEWLLATYQPELVGFELISNPKNYHYKVGNLVTTLNSFLGTKNGDVIVSNRGGIVIDPEEIKEYAGFRVNNTKVFFDKNTYIKNGCVYHKGRNVTKGE